MVRSSNSGIGGSIVLSAKLTTWLNDVGVSALMSAVSLVAEVEDMLSGESLGSNARGAESETAFSSSLGSSRDATSSGGFKD